MTTILNVPTATKNAKAETNVISEKARLQIIADYEAQKLAEAEAIKLAEAEAEAIKAAEAEAIKLAEAEAKKAEAKQILQGKKSIDNIVLAELLPFDIAFKYAIADINTNGIQKHLKEAQKTAFNQSQFEQLTKSLNLCLKQFSNDDLQKYVNDNKCTLPSKFITAIVNGSCKSVKAFDNSKTKVLPQNNKLS